MKKREKTEVALSRMVQAGGPATVEALISALEKAGAQRRETKAQTNAAKHRKECPCHLQPCQEHEQGGKLCGIGVCVRMN